MQCARKLVWAVLVASLAGGALDPARADLKLEQLWTHDAGGSGRAEIVAYDAAAKEFLIVNGTDQCVIRLDAHTGLELGRLEVSAFGNPTSVAAARGLVAVAVVAVPKTAPGHVVLFRSGESGTAPVAAVRVGALADMVTFSPDGRFVLSANEGEPSDDYSIDPEGSISVIDVGGAETAVALTADFLAFDIERDSLERQNVRIAGPSQRMPDGRATVSQDLEPEFIAISPNGRTAWVTLQENNAIAIVDVPTARVMRIVGLGLKDHSRAGRGLDASDRDGGIHIRPWPVYGIYQPDGIAAFEIDGQTYLATANEGDARRYGGFNEESRVRDLPLDASLTAGDRELTADCRLGRLLVSRVGGDIDDDGDVDRLLSFGGRSLAIWSAEGELIFDSSDAIEQFIARKFPERFNIDGDGGNVDSRSPEKGAEPEGVVVGWVDDAMYAFVGLERISAVAVFDVTRPATAKLLDVVPLALDKKSGGPHIAPEGLCFVPAERSPTGEPLLAVACEVTGTTILFRVRSVSQGEAAVE